MQHVPGPRIQSLLAMIAGQLGLLSAGIPHDHDVVEAIKVEAAKIRDLFDE